MDTTPLPASKKAKLTAVITAVTLARDLCTAIPPARAAFASVDTLLTMIRVCCFLLCDNEFLVHIFLGQNG